MGGREGKKEVGREVSKGEIEREGSKGRGGNRRRE